VGKIGICCPCQGNPPYLGQGYVLQSIIYYKYRALRRNYCAQSQLTRLSNTVHCTVQYRELSHLGPLCVLLWCNQCCGSGSGAFLPPGSGIRCLFYPPDPGSGSGMAQWSDPAPGKSSRIRNTGCNVGEGGLSHSAPVLVHGQLALDIPYRYYSVLLYAVSPLSTLCVALV
jgi:hypothetical protein